jgi:hypothetical protein
MHDALRRKASQGPAEEGEVEVISRLVPLDGRSNVEANAVAQLWRRRRTSCGDCLPIRIDSQHFFSLTRVAPGQAAFAAADLENS